MTLSSSFWTLLLQTEHWLSDAGSGAPCYLLAFLIHHFWWQTLLRMVRTLSFINASFSPTLFLKLLRVIFLCCLFDILSVLQYILHLLCSLSKNGSTGPTSFTDFLFFRRAVFFGLQLLRWAGWIYNKSSGQLMAAGTPAGTHSSGALLHIISSLKPINIKLEDNL